MDKLKLNTPPARLPKKQTGFTLIDYMIAAALTALVVAVLFSTFSQQSVERKINETVSVLTTAQTKLASNNRQLGSFNGLSSNGCYASNAFPDNWLDRGTPGQFITPFTSGATALTCAALSSATDIRGTALTGADKFAGISLAGVDAISCNSIAKQLITTYTEIQVDGNRVNSNALIDTNCGLDPSTTVSMTFITRI